MHFVEIITCNFNSIFLIPWLKRILQKMLDFFFFN